jgi:FAD:protein FMN transferase
LKIKKNKVLFNRRMDFSGIAKGYITDKAAEFLKNRGFQNFLIDSGGDMNASGTDEDKNPWSISIEGIDENKLNFNLSGKGIATSGITRKKWEKNGQKFHHLINPKNPQEFLFDLKTVTVVSENTERSDVWAKVLFLMGKEKGLKYSDENNIASAFLDYRGSMYLSGEIKKY